MYLNEIDFPNEIIDAIKNDRLVVFAGAGISMGAPTLLPDFNNLAKKVAKGTGYKLNDCPCDVFLGNLKSKGIDVNKHAADILSTSCVHHNKMHEAIVSLFPNSSKIKIVTSNYDQMLEQSLKKCGIATKVYNAPALPLGDDVEGIVHVHGNVDNPKYMVVTDEDFGKAYLTEGYATRFLVKLFESYTVLFIGYSYKDIILQYLTRAMARETVSNRFIMTCERDLQWKVIGLTPVFFPKNEFIKLREGIEKLGQRSKRGFLEWQSQLNEYADNPPRDMSAISELDYCLESIERTRMLANIIHGEEWLNYLDGKGVFGNLFNTDASLSDFDKTWMEWIVNTFINKDDESFFLLLMKNNNQIHPQFVMLILSNLKLNVETTNDTLKEYIVLFEQKVRNPWTISQLIYATYKRGMDNMSVRLFQKLFDYTFAVEEQFWPGKGSYEVKHRFVSDVYSIRKSWNSYKDVFLEKYPEELLWKMKDTICSLYEKYKAIDVDKKWHMAMLNIEDRKDNNREEVLSVVCNIFCECCKSIERKNTFFVKGLLINCLQSEFILVHKTALKALRESTSIESCDKFDMFMEHSSIVYTGAKEQIFLLIASIFRDLTESKQNQLIDMIENQNHYGKVRNNDYAKYNWCVWLKQNGVTNSRIDAIENKILALNDFAPRPHPELDIIFGDAVGIKDKSPINSQEMLQISMEDLIDVLNDYNEDSFERPSRWGLLGVFTECVKSNYLWTTKVLRGLLDSNIEKEDVWVRLLQGLSDSDYSIDEIVALFDIMIKHVSQVKNIQGLSELLCKLLQKEGMKDVYAKFETSFIKIARILWEHRGAVNTERKHLIDASFNTVLGNVLQSWIYMFYYCKDEGIPNRYKDFMETNLQLEDSEQEIACCILAGHFNFFCYRDMDWCIAHFANILSGQEARTFQAAWEGMAYFSRQINKDTADIMASIYIEAIKHLSWLSGEARKGLIDIYLVFLIYVVEDPFISYIPALYEAAEIGDINVFTNGIEHRLRTMDANTKAVWWNGWLRQHIINRYENKPSVLSEDELKTIMDWIPEAGDFYDELVGIICKNRVASQVDSLLLDRLNESELVNSSSHSTIKLLTTMLNAGTDFSYSDNAISEIYKKLEGLTDDEKREFQEAMLKRNITI